MEKFSFVEGARVRIDGKRFTLISETTVDGSACWIVAPFKASTNPNEKPIVQIHRKDELELWFSQNRLEFDDERDDDTPESLTRRRRRRATLISEKPEKKQVRISYRREVLKEVGKRLGWGKTAPITFQGQKTKDSILAKTLRDLGATLGMKYYAKEKTIGVATYYRWKAEFEVANDARDLEGDFDKRGNRKQMLQLVKKEIRQLMEDKLKAASKKNVRGQKPTLTMNDIMVDSLELIKALKKAHPELEDAIRLPSKSTFYNILNNNFDADLISRALRGYSKTRHDFRRPFGHEEPLACLSELQYDETLLPFYCFDDELKIPLGRPWLAWLVDVFSAAIVGFYCGFEPPGDVVFTSVLRHASLPKAYVRQVYPDIAGEYAMGGIGRSLTFDNSLSAHSRTIARISGDLDIPYDFTGARMPWLKGDVEGTFKDLNAALLSEMPGFVLSDKIDRADYDPAKHGSIGFLHLLWILHHYVIGVRHTHAPPGFGASPNQLWEEGTRIIKPQFPRAGTDLDFLFGIEREARRVDHRGVFFEHLWYYSDGIDILRRRDGPKLAVRVKVNPRDLGKILVYDKDEDIWIPCYALEQAYASGLDLHRHRLYLRHAELLSGSTNLQARIEARVHLHEMIRASADDAISIRNNSLIARAAGIGTHAIFNHLDHGGNLNLLASHFATGPALQTRPSPDRQRPNEPAIPTLKAADAPIVPTITQTKRRRELPIFAVEKSTRA